MAILFSIANGLIQSYHYGSITLFFIKMDVHRQKNLVIASILNINLGFRFQEFVTHFKILQCKRNRVSIWLPLPNVTKPLCVYR